ncbi:hypothetical protein ILUMI_19459 [Ignelater luminosus]|uniref:Mitochondrial transcription rescue factor 1 C-terminal domain-containing protein n=1 Tax=Ignelater luminosus TaxID=2038154 RepID=A0A8K0CI62_IGNLU|nr:hypothetical protein ILUMI_19459 [Ignelater luminosus]
MSILIKRRVILSLFTQIIRKTSYNNSRCLATLTQRMPPACTILNANIPNLEIYRNKSKASKKKEKAAAEESDEEESEEEQSADFDSLIVDKHTKIMTTKVNSLRADVILKNGLSMARNKVEEMFYESKIRVNGKKIFKKSDLVEVGDEIDIIKSVSDSNPNFLIVGRVEVLDVKPRNEGYAVRLRRCKSLTIENYEEPWKPGD